MKQWARMMADGMLSIADVFCSPRDYVRATSNGFQQDNLNLAGDTQRVGMDMETSIEKYRAQQQYRSTTP